MPATGLSRPVRAVWSPQAVTRIAARCSSHTHSLFLPTPHFTARPSTCSGRTAPTPAVAAARMAPGEAVFIGFRARRGGIFRMSARQRWTVPLCPTVANTWGLPQSLPAGMHGRWHPYCSSETCGGWRGLNCEAQRFVKITKKSCDITAF